MTFCLEQGSDSLMINGEYADFGEAEKEEKMFPLPENVIRLLTMNLGVSDKNLEEAKNNGHENFK